MTTAAERRRERGREEMRASILDAARRLIASEGLTNFSLRAVAREIGYSPAALYEYYGSKEDILDTLYFEGTDGLAGRMDQALAALPPDTSPRERMRALAQAYRRYAHDNRELFLMIFGNPMPERPDGGLMHAEHLAATVSVSEHPKSNAFQLLVETSAAGIDAGEFASVSAGELAIAAWSVVHGFVMIEICGMFGPQAPVMPTLAACGVKNHSPDALFTTTLDLFFSGFARGA